MTKSLVFVRRRWAVTGGAENYLRTLATALKERGWRTILICESWTEKVDGSFHEIVSIGKRGPSFAQPETFAKKVNCWIEQNRPACVFSMERGVRAHIYRAGDGVHGEWLRIRKSFLPWWKRLTLGLNLKHAVLKKLERDTFLNVPCLIANSEMVKRNILTHFPETRPDSIHIIQNGVDFKKFRSGNRTLGRKIFKISDDRFALLLVGAGAERKGHQFAKAVVSELGYDFKLIIVDRPAPCPMPDVYAAADAFLFPTLYDPFANVTLEAMAAGLPVLTTKNNGASEIIEHGKNGFVFNDPRAVDGMVETVLELKQKPDFQKQIRAAAQATAEKHDLPRHIEQTLGLLQKFVKN